MIELNILSRTPFTVYQNFIAFTPFKPVPV